MAEHPVCGERVDGGVEGGAGRNGHGDTGTIGVPTSGEGENETSAKCEMRNAEWTDRASCSAPDFEDRTLPIKSAFRTPHSALVHVAPPPLPSQKWFRHNVPGRPSDSPLPPPAEPPIF